MDDERLDAAALVGLIDIDWDDDDLKDYQMRKGKQRSRKWQTITEDRTGWRTVGSGLHRDSKG